ncbi:unnamed protein product [Effrenium voratum]|nr:unnamed protein product [Effrenium voratum]
MIVCLNSLDATLDVFVSASGVVSSLSQGAFRHLRSAIRANTGAKAGRYYFEVQVLETVPNAPICLLVGFSTDRSSLFLDSAESIAFDAEGRRWDPSKPKAKLAERVGLLLDRQALCLCGWGAGEG